METSAIIESGWLPTRRYSTEHGVEHEIGMHPEGVFITRFLESRMPNRFAESVFSTTSMTLMTGCSPPTRAGLMGLPSGMDVTGATRPDIERIPVDVRPNLGEVLDQDVELVAAVQRGSKSRGFRGPLWSDQEQRVRHFHRELDRYINRRQVAAGCRTQSLLPARAWH